ncbi:TPA: peptidase [Burkholderia cenocepacia]|uniref:peptidase n=1 Tax=unclassified Burkholderia TaxID=2613784 RepID=UPI0015886608|nr:MULTISPECIES: peptidase [unclassified Burkholderia]HEF5871181.1 peptidase [Burkholderia cenocepacia]
MSFRPGTLRSPSGAKSIAPARTSELSRIELDPRQDRHARAALEAYADSAAAEMPWLAEWLDERLRDAARDDGSGLTYCGATIERVFDLAQAWAAAQPDYAAGAWESVREQLQRMLAQPPLAEPQPHMPTDEFAAPVARVAGAE